MKLSESIILDLLPLYFDGDGSKETRALIEDYFNENPEFAGQMKKEFEQGIQIGFTSELKPEDKMLILKNTQKLLRLRTISLNTALFGTLFPFLYFTFYDFGDKVFEGYSWIWTDIGAYSMLLGMFAWVSYFALRFRMRTSGV